MKNTKDPVLKPIENIEDVKKAIRKLRKQAYGNMVNDYWMALDDVMSIINGKR